MSSEKIFLLLTILTVTSFCENKNHDYIVISGEVENIEPDINGDRFLYIDSDNRSWKIKLNKANVFRDTIRNDEGYFTLMDGKNPFKLFLERSKQYSISYDANNFRNGEVLLEGDKDLINQYLIEKFQKRVFVNTHDVEKTEQEFRKIIGDIKKDNLNRLNRANLKGEVQEKELKQINYEYLFNLNVFLANKTNEDSGFEPSLSSANELAIDYLNENDFKEYPEYRSLVFDHFREALFNLVRENRESNPYYSYELSSIQLISENVPNEYIKNYVIEGVALSNLMRVDNIEAYYNDFKRYYTGKNESFISQIESSFFSLSELQEVSYSPEFKDYTNFAGGKNSLRDYRGKFVYIDFWASWCGNCYGEMPYFRKLEEEYKDKDVIFISISIDENAGDWRRTIEAEKLKGIQLLAEKEENGFIDQFAVYGVPRYILIDPEGKIIDYDAPRPSQEEELKKLFSASGI